MYRHRLIRPRAILSLPTGEVFVIGRDRKAGVLAVEWWSAKGGASHIAPLPNHIFWDRWDPTFSRGQLVADGPNRVYAVGLAEIESQDLPYLAHFDGKAWRAEAVEELLPGSITSLAAGQGGVLVVSKGQVWRRTYDSDTWQRLAGNADEDHLSGIGVIVEGGRLVQRGDQVFFVRTVPEGPSP